MVITLNSSSFSEVIDDLARGLSAEVKKNNGEVVIQLPAVSGKGTIQAMRFHSGLSLIILDMQLVESLTIHVLQTDYHPLRLMLCQQGSLIHSVEERHIQYQLNKLYCSLSACSGNVDQLFQLPANQSLSIVMIEIDRKYYLERLKRVPGEINNRIRTLFEDTKAKFPFLYHSFYSHAVASVLHDLSRTLQYQAEILELYMEAKVLELLSLTLHQYVHDQQLDRKEIVLREHDVEQIVKVKQHVTEHYADPPSIPELARQFGINEAKLKKGFKQLFHSTIYEHIRNERMHQARLLLAEGSRSIREVVREVGYSSDSQFAARFRETFGWSPKQFQKKIEQSGTNSPTKE